MYLLDTHALLWWTLDPERLSRRAAAACERIQERGGGVVSSISIWELGVKIRNGKLDIGMPIEVYAGKLQELGSLELVPVDTAQWLANLRLEWTNRDPADRTIVALARARDLPIVTRDEAIRKFYPKTVW